MPKVVVRFDGTPARLGAAVTEHIEGMKAQYSKSHVENRVITLRKLRRVVGDETWIHDITPQDVTRFWNEICTTRSNNSQCIDHNATKKFFEWCDDMGYRAGISPMKHIRAPKPFYKERRRVPVEQFPDLLAAASLTPRDRMFVACGLYMLCRKVEMYNIPWGHVDRAGGVIYITRTKTDDDDFLAISDELEDELGYYEDWYRYCTDTPKHQALNPKWYLTPSFTKPFFTGGKAWHRGLIRPTVIMDRQAGSRLVKRALDGIGFPTTDFLTGKSTKEGAHTLRRSGARALYDAMIDAGEVAALRHVQLQLGHATPGQTQKYIGAEADKQTRNALIKGKVMYPKAAAAKAVLVADPEEVKKYGHLRVVS